MKHLYISLLILSGLVSCKPNNTTKFPTKNTFSNHDTTAVDVAVKKVVLSPPRQTTTQFNHQTITIDYSAPSVRNRNIFGGTLPYDEMWIAGAGRATWIETPLAMHFDQGVLPPGKYSLYMIPSPTDWVVIFNSHWDQNGKDEYDAAKDVLRLNLRPLITPMLTERLVYELVKKDETTGSIHFAWEKAIVDVDFTLE